jgi:hypothetical protein
MMVARVWAKQGLKPQRLERYMASDDPDFETKAADRSATEVKTPRAITSRSILPNQIRPD